jgi:outer membrane protein OmpA-like peptidoglycan-associated protein
LVEAIRSAVAILRESGGLAADPLPDGDPYRLTNRQFVADLYRAAGGSAKQTQGKVAPLDQAGWQRLKEVGTLDVQPIGFQSGTADLTYEGKQELDRVAERLKHYPRFRILVKGHTGLKGDPQANLTLSQERAEAVTRYLLVTHDLDPNRLRSLGYGADRPLPQKPGESERAHAYRLPRVELVLAAESL